MPNAKSPSKVWASFPNTIATDDGEEFVLVDSFEGPTRPVKTIYQMTPGERTTYRQKLVARLHTEQHEHETKDYWVRDKTGKALYFDEGDSWEGACLRGIQRGVLAILDDLIEQD